MRRSFRQNKLHAVFQKKLGYFIYDFYLPKIKVLIEVDGSYHLLEKQKIRDIKKSNFAEKCGYHLIRVTNEEIENNVITVVNKILDFCNQFGRRRKRFYRVFKRGFSRGFSAQITRNAHA